MPHYQRIFFNVNITSDYVESIYSIVVQRMKFGSINCRIIMNFNIVVILIVLFCLCTQMTMIPTIDKKLIVNLKTQVMKKRKNILWNIYSIVLFFSDFWQSQMSSAGEWLTDFSLKFRTFFAYTFALIMQKYNNNSQLMMLLNFQSYVT